VIEVLILTGFLGSGKTTLLGRLLRQPEFSRTAVIVNEFGEIGLDHDLIEASEDNLVALLTGCLCCKIRSDLATTIHDLLRQSWLFANPDAHDHHHGIETYALVRFEPLRAVTLTLFLEAIAEHCGADLLRLKGIVNILESPERPAVIHGVQHVFHPPTWLRGWPSDDRRSRMIFITRGIPRVWIEALLAALDAEVAAVSRGMSI
jgi:G3E family GTPase